MGIELRGLQPSDTDYAYKMGFDCGRNGPNTTNCDFRIFGTPEGTKAWERGKAAAERAKKEANLTNEDAIRNHQ